MTINKLFIQAILLLAVLISCNKNDEGKTNPVIQNEMAGNYRAENFVVDSRTNGVSVIEEDKNAQMNVQYIKNNTVKITIATTSQYLTEKSFTADLKPALPDTGDISSYVFSKKIDSTGTHVSAISGEFRAYRGTMAVFQNSLRFFYRNYQLVNGQYTSEGTLVHATMYKQ